MIQSLMNLMVELRLSYIKTWQPSHFVGTMTEMQKLIHLPLNLVEGSRPARGSLLRDRLEAADWIQFLIPVLWVVSPVSVWTKSNSTKSNLCNQIQPRLGSNSLKPFFWNRIQFFGALQTPRCEEPASLSSWPTSLRKRNPRDRSLKPPTGRSLW